MIGFLLWAAAALWVGMAFYLWGVTRADRLYHKLRWYHGLSAIIWPIYLLIMLGWVVLTTTLSFFRDPPRLLP